MPARTRHHRIFVAALSLAILSGPARAAEPPATHSTHSDATGAALSFDEAVGGSAQAPGLVGLEEAVAEKRRSDETLPLLSQGMQVQLMPGGRLPPADQPGFEAQWMVTQGWSLGGYGHKRRDAAAAESEVMAAEARALALEQELGAALAWIRLHEAEARLVLARRELETAGELQAVLEEAVAAGVATRVDLAEARATVAEAQAAVTPPLRHRTAT
ncbi:MAG: TolC family protein [Myxococcales bacterium]|nr:TolC family protein [Myxococcales bacterium]